MKTNKYFALLVLFNFLMTACVQKTYKKTVTFIVDTQSDSTISNLFIRGDFDPLNWEDNIVLEDKNCDGIYSSTITFDTPFDFVDFKFVKNDAEFELMDKDNRRVNFNGLDSITYTAIFDVAD